MLNVLHLVTGSNPYPTGYRPSRGIGGAINTPELPLVGRTAGGVCSVCGVGGKGRVSIGTGGSWLYPPSWAAC